MTARRTTFLFTALGLLTAALFIADLAVGSVAVPLGDVWAALTGGACDPAVSDIILKIRLLKAVTALFAGAALAAGGLEMQTLFRNPLAGPYVLGVSSGAGLGVALFLLGAPLLGVAGHSFVRSLGVAGRGVARLGARAGRRDGGQPPHQGHHGHPHPRHDARFGHQLGGRNPPIPVERGGSQIVRHLDHGIAGRRHGQPARAAVPVVTAGLALAVAVIKPLNLLLLGENYARTMGLNVQRTRTLIFLSTVLLAGTVTAFCGPVGFIGLAVPHLARMLFASADHRILMPGSMLTGAALLLVCDLVSKSLALPINTITALMGIPVVIFVVVRNRNIF